MKSVRLLDGNFDNCNDPRRRNFAEVRLLRALRFSRRLRVLDLARDCVRQLNVAALTQPSKHVARFPPDEFERFRAARRTFDLLELPEFTDDDDVPEQFGMTVVLDMHHVERERIGVAEKAVPAERALDVESFPREGIATNTGLLFADDLQKLRRDDLKGRVSSQSAAAIAAVE
jgi:hypothetical protein